MRQATPLLVAAALVAALASPAFGQADTLSAEYIFREHPAGQTYEVRNGGVRVHERPDGDVLRYLYDTTVLCYREEQNYCAVATRQEGHLGFVHASALRRENAGASVIRDPIAVSDNRKDPTTATLFGVLLSGGGHLYAGEVGRGAGLFAVSLAAPLAGAAASTTSATCSTTTTSATCTSNTNFLPLYVGIGVGLAAWVYGIADASEAADRQNRERGLSSRVALSPKVARSNGETSFGAHLSLSF